MSTTSSATDETLLRLPQVLARFPVSRSGWYQGVKTGRYPQPVRIGERAVAWKASDIRRLVQAATA
ncbi:helix-turn-helix transcriptional regulator [Diaphorobacter nitroreducens]|uniref:helix-turn-helix transcriptional regulator n=1 Tax=Diaphorobacter nitroreducens TaxID=164759 RepID=UPI00289BD072|nr:AlpA family phage regulatory protein [Diaphorobacter nitroreducens]